MLEYREHIKYAGGVLNHRSMDTVEPRNPTGM